MFLWPKSVIKHTPNNQFSTQLRPIYPIGPNSKSSLKLIYFNDFYE